MRLPLNSQKGDMTSTRTPTERLSALPTAAVSDALDARGLPGSLAGIGRVTGSTLTGTAFTVRYEPVAGDDGTVGDFLDDIPRGSAVVIDNAGRLDCTVWGGIMSRVAAARGIAGTVINGVCRDVTASQEVGYSLWAAGRFMRTGKDRVRCVAVQTPVVIDDVTINPGDYVHADADGVVVVPAPHIDATLDLAEHIERIETVIVETTIAGTPLAEARRRFGYHTLQTRSAG